ncbi:cell surface glycoprotein CD200 receptor 3 isoform X7 [Mus musculus]|uniref:cell surface glycoprotein CD200 receptor 3 isoform X7 n=1 Tax=Mus musculus TaxID=10090 RepID=UPI0005ABA270|nr:cell surface glycoprotein CD200 receptor 3 isoform X7 [Mus musculus]|eukprot:XP_011244337.1 PREDICTED: cell surface glycoprotein CD200 receptor 3 isoform X7 [Mus musculus]
MHALGRTLALMLLIFITILVPESSCSVKGREEIPPDDSFPFSDDNIFPDGVGVTMEIESTTSILPSLLSILYVKLAVTVLIVGFAFFQKRNYFRFMLQPPNFTSPYFNNPLSSTYANDCEDIHWTVVNPSGATSLKKATYKVFLSGMTSNSGSRALWSEYVVNGAGICDMGSLIRTVTLKQIHLLVVLGGRITPL